MPLPFSHGAASYGAGVGPAGHDPEAELEDAAPPAPVRALYFDPFDRVYVQNADLSMLEGAGPIQRAAHLLLPLGSLPAVAGSGFDVDAVKRAAPAARQLAVEDALRRTWKRLLEAGEIEMGRVMLLDIDGAEWTLDSVRPWTGLFEVAVKDLVTRESATLDGKVT